MRSRGEDKVREVGGTWISGSSNIQGELLCVCGLLRLVGSICNCPFCVWMGDGRRWRWWMRGNEREGGIRGHTKREI